MKVSNDVAIPDIAQPDWDNVAELPITECGEGMQPTSLAPSPIRVYPAYYKMGIPSAPPECLVRQGVYERLLTAAAHLPPGLNLVILDGWRPFSVQQHLFDTLLNLMERIHPEHKLEALIAEARNLVSPPSTLISAPSPHLTGGSVDVTLADDSGRLLDMGTQFDEASPLSYTASLERISSLTPTQVCARDNRRLLYQVMTAAGFTNLPSEWWHFDYGNQLWAWSTGVEKAIYGATHPDSLEHMWERQLRANLTKRPHH